MDIHVLTNKTAFKVVHRDIFNQHTVWPLSLAQLFTKSNTLSNNTKGIHAQFVVLLHVVYIVPSLFLMINIFLPLSLCWMYVDDGDFCFNDCPVFL